MQCIVERLCPDIATKKSPITTDTHLRYALISLVEEDLRHAFDCDRKRDDGVFTARSTHAVASTGADCTEHSITSLTEQQFLQHERYKDLVVMQSDEALLDYKFLLHHRTEV
jgi:hypothetical protein